MIIQDESGNKVIEIGTDISVIDKIVMYEEVSDDEVALVECKVQKGSLLEELGVGVEIGCRRVSDEWLDICDGKISEVLDYFEKRTKDDEKEFRVVFDEDKLPKWFNKLQEQSGLRAVRLYEFLIDLGIK